MNSIFEEVWNGHITPYADCGSGDPEVEELQILLSRCEAKLGNLLDGEQKKALKNYQDCRSQYEYLLRVHAYRQGFTLACRLLTDTLQQRE